MVLHSPSAPGLRQEFSPLAIIRLLGSALMCAAIATPVSADVTLRSKRSETVDGGDRIIDVTEYRKGLKMRTDLSGSGITRMSMIVDAATGRMVMLFPDGKTAEVSDWLQGPALPRRGGIPEYKQSITPTGGSRQIAGSTCTVYDVRSSARYPEMERDGAVITVLEGSICLVKDGPGQAEFSAMYRAYRAQTAFDGVLQMNPQMTELGVPFATQLTLRMGGDTMTKEVSTSTTEVISVSTTSIPDEIFEIPEGYTVIQR
jgi:hypothetical protein